MPIPVNIEQLLSATSIEGARIEYKKGWNPSVCYSQTGRDSEIDKGRRKNDGRNTRAQMSGQLKISEATIKREIKYIREHGILRYDGPARSGKWIVNTDIDIAVHQ